MSEELKDITLIEAYLNNELGAKQRQAVETRRDNDPAFSQLMEDLEVMFEGTRSAYREDIETQLQGFEADLPPVEIDEAALLLDDLPQQATETQETVSKSGSVQRWWKIAAILIPLIGIMTWMLWPQQSAQEKLFTSHFKKEVSTLLTATRGGSNEALSRKASEALTNKNYTQALTLYQALYNDTQDQDHLFFLGISYLGAGQVEQAFQQLEGYKDKGKNILLLAEVDYFKALGHVRNGTLQKALQLLEPRQDEKSKTLINNINQYNSSKK